MADLLVILYEIPSAQPDIDALAEKNIVIRRPIGPENWGVIAWIKKHFGDGWASEAENAFFRSPKSIYIAIRENKDENGNITPEMLGFACYDATVKGFFGPTGVAVEERGQGIGKALLLACLNAMKEEGYGYGIIGSAGPVKFYEKTCGATVIEGSDPGVYRGMYLG